jgi:hypothetical protein
MESLAILGIMIIGFMVMFGIMPLKKVPVWIIGITLFAIYLPVLISFFHAKFIELVTRKYPWWMYIFVFFGVLFLMRLLIEFLFPGRKR